jgi:hypothetical protein
LRKKSGAEERWACTLVQFPTTNEGGMAVVICDPLAVCEVSLTEDIKWVKVAMRVKGYIHAVYVRLSMRKTR